METETDFKSLWNRFSGNAPLTLTLNWPASEEHDSRLIFKLWAWPCFARIVSDVHEPSVVCVLRPMKLLTILRKLVL